MDLRLSERELNLVMYVHIYEARGLRANHRRIFKLRLLNNKGLTKLVLPEWCDGCNLSEGNHRLLYSVKQESACDLHCLLCQ